MELDVFLHCLHPQRIFNVNTKSWEYVPCKKCVACRNRYAADISSRVAMECKQHRYAYFFTLTYSNEYLPIAEVVTSDEGYTDIHPVGRLNTICKFAPFRPFRTVGSDSDTFDGEVYSPLKVVNHKPVRDKSFELNQFAVLSRDDVKNFLKRLRYNISKRFKYEKKYPRFRYFICGEYGPKTFRPHYHGILFYDSESLHKQILSLIRESWAEKIRVGNNRFSFRPFCSADRFAESSSPNDKSATCGLVNSTAPQYVAKYVAGNASLPQIYKLKFTRPFHLCSKNPVMGNFKNGEKEVFDHFSDAFRSEHVTARSAKEVITHVSTRWDSASQSLVPVSVPFPQSILAATWRKCYRYNEISNFTKLSTYSFIYRYRTEYIKFGREGLSRLHSLEYESLLMDRPDNWSASVKCYRICKEVGCSPTYYLLVFDYYLRTYQQYKLQMFYELQENYVQQLHSVRCLARAYPMSFELLPLRLDFNNLSSIPLFFNHFKNLGYTLEEFYPDGLHLDIKFVSSLREESSVQYDSFAKSELYVNDKSNKSKKINNTSTSSINLRLE